jgi:hypothetical protein
MSILFLNNFRLKIYQFARFVFLISSLTSVYGQIGLKMQSPLLKEQFGDSAGVTFPKPVLPLHNWQILTDTYVEFGKTSTALNVYDYISPDYIPRNPFELDLRGTSNYVPRQVRDELNLMMNRPRDSAFLPILPVAFLALQLASQHLLISKKTEITAQDIKGSEIALPILEHLWAESPQTLTQLFKHEDLANRYTMQQLEKHMFLLIDNKLVKTRKIENAETKYFFALDRRHYLNILKKAKEKEEALRYPESSVILSDPKSK